MGEASAMAGEGEVKTKIPHSYCSSPMANGDDNEMKLASNYHSSEEDLGDEPDIHQSRYSSPVANVHIADDIDTKFSSNYHSSEENLGDDSSPTANGDSSNNEEDLEEEEEIDSPPPTPNALVQNVDDNDTKTVGEEEEEKKKKDNKIVSQDKEMITICPPLHLPQPEAPAGVMLTMTKSPSSPSLHSNSLGRFLLERSYTFSSAIAKRFSSLKDDSNGDTDTDADTETCTVTEFQLSGLKVIVSMKEEEEDDYEPAIKGRISFFTRSSCRDCTAVRTFLREKGLSYVEINIDVFPERERELVERTGTKSVPQIFFNDRLLGGLLVLNSLRNSGEFDDRLREMAGDKCPDTAPRVPVYGFDDEEDVMKRRTRDVMMGIVRVLRLRLPIQDRIMKIKIIKNCFSGSHMVDGIIHQLGCARKKAVEIGKELARKHFIHHVFRENDFEDCSSQFYYFLEHDPAIQKCFNFRGTTNDEEPKAASVVGQRLTKLMSAILEAYASDDRTRLDYDRIATSEEFRRYVNLVQDLQRIDLSILSVDETMAFFLNLYNAMVIHAIIRIGRPGSIDRRAFFIDFQYVVGGYTYSLSAIKNGILRMNRRQPYSFIKPFNAGDKRLELALPKLNPLIHFGLCNGTRSCPTVRFFSAQGVDVELRYAARYFFLNGGVDVDLSRRTVKLTRIIKWYNVDFGPEKDILKWVMNYLDATKAGLLTYLLNDGGQVNIAYQDFDWSLNSI